jgi:hypothetical protein
MPAVSMGVFENDNAKILPEAQYYNDYNELDECFAYAMLAE